MGGILVKEMLAKALQSDAPAHRRQLAEAAQGLIFYACPHLGSWLADWGWTLRWLGASPAAAVLHLKPGPHLQVLCCMPAPCMIRQDVLHLQLSQLTL